MFPDEARRHGGGESDVPVLAGLERDRDEGGGPQADRRHQSQHLAKAGTMDQNFGTG